MTYSRDEAGNDALRTLDEAHEKLITAVNAAAARGVKGPWGPREILAHVVGWEVIAIHRLPKLIAGEAPLTYDEDAVNVAMVTLVGDQPLETIRDMLYQAHHRFLHIPEVQSLASFVPGHPVYERTKAAIRHSFEHAQELDKMS